MFLLLPIYSLSISTFPVLLTCLPPWEFSVVGSVDRKLSDLERSVSNLTESVSLHLSKLHEKGWSIFKSLLIIGYLGHCCMFFFSLLVSYSFQETEQIRLKYIEHNHHYESDSITSYAVKNNSYRSMSEMRKKYITQMYNMKQHNSSSPWSTIQWFRTEGSRLNTTIYDGIERTYCGQTSADVT